MRKRKICVFESEINGVSLESVLKECELGELEFVELTTPADLKGCELLLLGQGMLDSLTQGKAICDFVCGGGTCWIMHQGEAANTGWLPEELRQVKLENRYFVPLAEGGGASVNSARAISGLITPR